MGSQALSDLERPSVIGSHTDGDDRVGGTYECTRDCATDTSHEPRVWLGFHDKHKGRMSTGKFRVYLLVGS